MADVSCAYCGGAAVLVDGMAIYPHRRDLAWKHFWKCEKCPDVYVGCHPHTTRPLGRLADKALRAAKSRAHAAFDPLWKAKMATGIKQGKARGLGYQWLGRQLGIDAVVCHIGMFDVATCDRVVAICQPYAQKLARAA